VVKERDKIFPLESGRTDALERKKPTGFGYSRRRSMTKVKLLSAVVLAAAALTTPAMARGSFVGTQQAFSNAYASTVPAERSADVGCVRAPRVGAFATAPWTNPPFEPNTAF
jgi:hypothetical protein